MYGASDALRCATVCISSLPTLAIWRKDFITQFYYGEQNCNLKDIEKAVSNKCNVEVTLRRASLDVSATACTRSEVRKEPATWLHAT